MNTETLEKMRQMRLLGMHQAFKTSIETNRSVALSADELVSELINSEWDDRRQRSMERAVRGARFRYSASIEGLDYSEERGLDRNLVGRLGSGDYIGQGSDVLITGSTGTGKSYLATALGYEACQQGYKVLYANTARLMASLKMARADGSLVRELLRIEKQDVLILDDFGLQPLDAQSRSTLLDIIEDRHGKRSTVITSQVPVGGWYDIIGERTVADAILDRLVHHGIRIELGGESLRRKGKKESGG
jgi:DNA replication protein DnaC